jgi:hypothetical protein
MKKNIFFGIIFIGIIFIQATYAQNSCKRIHNFCTENLPDDEAKSGEDWIFDNQSKSATFEKGKVYEMSFVAYNNFIYRIATCTDIIEGSENLQFEVFRNELVRKTVNGKTRLLKEKTSIFNNSTDEFKSFYKFIVNKTEKIYVKVSIPVAGESSAKQYKDSKFVCVGVLLEHRRLKKIGF